MIISVFELWLVCPWASIHLRLYDSHVRIMSTHIGMAGLFVSNPNPNVRGCRPRVSPGKRRGQALKRGRPRRSAGAQRSGSTWNLCKEEKLSCSLDRTSSPLRAQFNIISHAGSAGIKMPHSDRLKLASTSGYGSG